MFSLSKNSDNCSKVVVSHTHRHFTQETTCCFLSSKLLAFLFACLFNEDQGKYWLVDSEPTLSLLLAHFCHTLSQKSGKRNSCQQVSGLSMPLKGCSSAPSRYADKLFATLRHLQQRKGAKWKPANAMARARQQVAADQQEEEEECGRSRSLQVANKNNYRFYAKQ